jgi:hypothetical protein
MVDISNSMNITVDDFVELVGEQISLSDISMWAKMPIYFIACGINPKIIKVTANEYIEENMQIANIKLIDQQTRITNF